MLKVRLPSARFVTLSYGLLLAACFLWLWDRLPFHNDILVYVYPERTFNLEALGRGLVPLWNPYLSCGVPHLANWLSAFFYPPYWLLNLTGISRGLVALAILHAAWAYAGFLLWARSRKAPGWAAALGALSFAGSAFFIRCWVILPFITTASWIPWVFWAFRRWTDRPGPRESALAVLVLSLQLLAGYPIFVFYTWAALSAWLLSRRLPPGLLGRAALLAGAALLLTVLQWLPFLELLTYARHGGWKVFPYYTHPWEFLTLLKPTVLGVPGAFNYRSNATNALFGNLYFGLVPCLAWMASLAFPKRGGRFWGLLSAFLLAWMAGPLLWKFIPSEAFNLLEPSKALGVFLFAACTSFCRFLGNSAPPGPLGKPAAAWALVLLCLLDLSALPFRLTSPVPDPYRDPVLQRQVSEIRRETAGRRIVALQDASRMTVSGPRLDGALEEKLSGVFVRHLLPDSNMVWGLRTVGAYFSLQTGGLKDILRYLNRGFPYRGGLLDVAGVRAFYLPQPLPPPKYQSAGRIGDGYLSIDPGASADFRWVGGAETFPDRPSILNRLARPGSGWRRKVGLEGKAGGGFLSLPALHRGPAAPLPPSNPARDWAGRRTALLRCPKAGYVVFDESYAPGWHAWVDGKPRPILRAYGLFMAVAAGPGLHRVDFHYEPATFRLGLFLSLSALAALSAAFGLRALQKIH